MEEQKINNKRIIIIMCLTIAATSMCTAQSIWNVRKGCVVVQGNLAPGVFLSTKQVSAYFNGDAEVFLDDRFAYEGAIWYSFATTRPNQPGIKANHAVFSGAEYHFLKPRRWDPFVSITPGLGFVQVAYNNGDGITVAPYSLAPLISMSAGCNYYVGWIFHFFVKVQGVVGQTFGELPVAQRIDEIKITCGLGLNLRAWKPKKRDKWKDGMIG
jgi:hypothetical protein